MNKDTGFILEKKTYISGERWTGNSKVDLSYYAGKDDTGNIDVYTDDKYKAVIFNSNRERGRMRAPNPFRRVDVDKVIVDSSFIRKHKIEERKKEKRRLGVFSGMLDKIKEVIS